MAFGFLALGFLPLPEAMMIGYAAPLMVVALSAVILGEVVRVYRWTATAIGFVGILIILWPRLTFFSGSSGIEEAAALLGAGLALLGAFSSAFAAIFIRSMTRTEFDRFDRHLLRDQRHAVLAAVAALGWVVPRAARRTSSVAIGLLEGPARS